jgi:hypothetical protein
MRLYGQRARGILCFQLTHDRPAENHLIFMRPLRHTSPMKGLLYRDPSLLVP